MSESARKIIKYFCDRFLDIDYYPTSIKAILDLDLGKLKGLEKEDVLKFEKINIKTFKDVVKHDLEELEKLGEKVSLDKKVLKNVPVAAYLITNAWNKRKVYIKKPKMKVVIAGLDYAGKTSLINRLINDYNYEDMINLEPTVGANIEEYQSEKVDLILWDLGGQRDHLNEYLSSPEQFFVQVDVLIYVFDSQDDLRYLEAIKYLNDIINILTFLNENPYILILLNKADSDIMNDPDYQIKIEYLTDKITEIFKNSEKSWTFEIIPTSIYNFYSKEPEIARSIKNIFSYKEKDEVKLLPEIDEKIRRILDINLKLMDKVVSELAEIKRILFRLNPLDFSVEGFSIPFEKVPIDYITIEDQNLAKTKKKKSKEKLKELSRAKFLKKKAGPPKQRPSFLSIEKEEKEKQKAGKITEETLKETLSSLKRVQGEQEFPKTPPMAPKLLNTSIGSLKPPPPPKIEENISSAPDNNRATVISELKELFIKRGLVSK